MTQQYQILSTVNRSAESTLADPARFSGRQEKTTDDTVKNLSQEGDSPKTTEVKEGGTSDTEADVQKLIPKTRVSRGRRKTAKQKNLHKIINDVEV